MSCVRARRTDRQETLAAVLHRLRSLAARWPAERAVAHLKTSEWAYASLFAFSAFRFSRCSSPKLPTSEPGAEGAFDRSSTGVRADTDNACTRSDSSAARMS